MGSAEFVHDPAFNVALALAVGMLAQALARHLRVPGIVLLLAAGVVLGPDLLGIVRPDSLGEALPMLVGFAVAVILFEGGLNLNLKRLRREGRSIRQLVTWGALVTMAGGAVAAHFALRWNWTLSLLFGSLVIVTGPTVINPLLRRIRVTPNLATVLEAEGVLIDAIGAIVAVVTLEVALSPTGEHFALGLGQVALRLGFGTALGVLAGFLIGFLLRFERVVPEGLENVFTLSIVLAIFQLSNALLEESGIVAVAAAGLVVGNIKTRVLADLKEFKEQLTVLLIGMLFVLLAADVRLAEVKGLGWGGVVTVMLLMLVVRPINVAVGTWRAGMPWREKAFLSWLAPRGIVAAAVSSLFAAELDAADIPGGGELRALVFLVIAVTVLVQGLTGGFVAGLLGVRREANSGWAILGANPLGLTVGGLLREGGQEVVFLDSNADACRNAEARGFRVLFGNALRESLLLRAQLDSRAGALAVTSNESANLVFMRHAREEFGVPEAWVALRSDEVGVTPKIVAERGGRLLFGRPRNLDLWSVRLGRGNATVRRWRQNEDSEQSAAEAPETSRHPMNFVLLLALRRGANVSPIDERTSFRAGDEAWIAVLEERQVEGEAWLAQQGWSLVEDDDDGDEATAELPVVRPG